MAGFFGLFGKKTKYVDEAENNNNAQDPQDAYFLSPDEAKTFGNIDFMRRPSVNKKRFPKTLRNPEGFETIKQVSAMEEMTMSGDRTETPSPQEQAAQNNGNGASPQERRTADSNMDMWRKMARDMKK